MAAYTQYVKGQEPLPELRQRLAGELGIPELQAQLEPLRQQALRTGQTLLDLPEAIGERTKGALVTEMQRRAIETAQGAQLERQLRDIAISQEYFAGQLAGAQGELGQQVSAYGAEFERQLLPFEKDLDVTQQRMAREAAGYTTSFQNELNALLADITRAEQLSDDARKRAHELALLEREYELRAQQVSAGGSSSGSSQNTTQGNTVTSTATKELQALVNLAKSKGVSATVGFQRVLDSLKKRFPNYIKEIEAAARKVAGGGSGGFEDL